MKKFFLKIKNNLEIFCKSGSIFGGAYGDSRMPNWPHRHRTIFRRIAKVTKVATKSYPSALFSIIGTKLSCVKARPHLYANANKACEPEVNANECQKVACSAFVTQANEQACSSHSLAARMNVPPHQYDCECIFL